MGKLPQWWQKHEHIIIHGHLRKSQNQELDYQEFHSGIDNLLNAV